MLSVELPPFLFYCFVFFISLVYGFIIYKDCTFVNTISDFFIIFQSLSVFTKKFIKLCIYTIILFELSDNLFFLRPFFHFPHSVIYYIYDARVKRPESTSCLHEGGCMALGPARDED